MNAKTYYAILTNGPDVCRSIFTSLDNARKAARKIAEGGRCSNTILVGYDNRSDAKEASLADYIGKRTAVLVERFEAASIKRANV